MTWIKRVWNRVRGRHQRVIQRNGRSKYPKHKLSKESFQSPQSAPENSNIINTTNKEDDSGLYHCSAPPPVVIEPIIGIEDDSMMNNEYKQPIKHSIPVRKPGGELHMIIERERHSVEQDHQSSKDVDHGHHSSKPKE